jgi:hypothetical protein
MGDHGRNTYSTIIAAVGHLNDAQAMLGECWAYHAQYLCKIGVPRFKEWVLGRLARVLNLTLGGS